MPTPISLEDLTKRAEAGDASAQYSLAAYLAGKGRRDEADRWLAAAVAGGEPEALYTMATRRTHTRQGILAVASELQDAVSKGSPSAAHLVAVLRATGIGFPRDDDAALALVFDGARRGLIPFRKDIGALLLLQQTDDPDGAALIAGGAPRDWAGVAQRLTLAPPPLQTAESVCASPDVTIVRNAVPRAVCDFIIAHAAPRLGPALVYNPQGAGMMRDPMRSSATASLAPLDLTLAVVALNRTMAAAAGVPDPQGEFLSVMRYRPGEEYRPHFDIIPAGPDLDRNGQRVKTALLYLNDAYQGGETAFLTPGITVKGGTGDILVFSNVLADGRGDPASRHAGLPVTSGEKWLASKWFRERNFDF
jgi:hypothetical protein